MGSEDNNKPSTSFRGVVIVVGAIVGLFAVGGGVVPVGANRTSPEVLWVVLFIVFPIAGLVWWLNKVFGNTGEK